LWSRGPRGATLWFATWRRSTLGNALVELALASALLALILLGATDFGRVFYTAMAVSHAAKAGVEYGAQSSAKAADTSGMTSAATTAASDLASWQYFTTTASKFCTCPSSTGVVACTGTPCGTGVSQWVYASVTATAQFTTLVNYPGIPHSLTVTRGAIMRAK
jgi:Flp pilus assembly protein TadG